VDDKGLAMIFVFGLPGYRRNSQQTPAILAAGKVLDRMAAAGVPGTAGVSSGMCFCGIIGKPDIRCEYAVMGGKPPLRRAFSTFKLTTTNQRRHKRLYT
jgi:hypothetical protein